MGRRPSKKATKQAGARSMGSSGRASSPLDSVAGFVEPKDLGVQPSDPQVQRDHEALARDVVGEGAVPAERPTIVMPRAGEAGLLLEFAWEVCNQVGGIYQVIRSKVPFVRSRWGDRYMLVGPYDAGKVGLEFEPAPAPEWLEAVIGRLRDEGLRVHHGTWLIPGRPRVLLLEHWGSAEYLAKAKYAIWKDHGIETPGSDWLIDGVVSFADASRRLVEAIAEERTRRAHEGTVIAHFHEWMSGLAIPMLRHRNVSVTTVFTTHATLLGRYIASAHDDLYDRLPWIDQAHEAAAYNIRPQHAIERASAHGAHVLTTVSSITAEECASLLGRSVDVVTPNGLSIGMYNAGHDQQRFHQEYKDWIHRFTMGHFFPSYSFDLDRTLYFFTSGRFEPHNKGFDLCLEAMARLNSELKTRNLGKTVVFFVVSRRATKGINPLAMEKRGVLNELWEVCEKITQGVGSRLFYRSASGGRLKLDDLVDEYWMLRYRRAQHALRQPCLPMVVTHILEDDVHDPVLNHIRVLGLLNREEDPVKVVYHPDFITPTNRLWEIEYDQFVRGCHMGIFPSLYEPWGYTPLECIAMGVPAVTSDLAGFGRYAQETYQDHDAWGLTVLKRRGRSFQDAAGDLARRMLDFCTLERRDRIALRNEVDRRSWEFDWEKLGKAYTTAYDLALARFDAERSGEAGGVAMVSAASLVAGRRMGIGLHRTS